MKVHRAGVHDHRRGGRQFDRALQQSIPTKIRQLILYINDSKDQVEEFLGELTFAKQLLKHFV